MQVVTSFTAYLFMVIELREEQAGFRLFISLFLQNSYSLRETILSTLILSFYLMTNG
jgi:hypothetical protein